jgi:phage baseplate assembly protein W
MSENEDDIKESIGIIIETAAGERVMRPDFGCGIHDMVFAVINSSTLSRVEAQVKKALIKYEPRIDIIEVKVTYSDTEAGKLIIQVDYQVRETNNAFNYVYDFYLHEGNG